MKRRRTALGERRGDIYVAVTEPVQRGTVVTIPTIENGHTVSPAHGPVAQIGGVTLTAFKKRGWIRYYGVATARIAP